MKTRYSIGSYLTPGILPRGRIQSIGPNGNSLLARILDVINVMESSYYFVLNSFTKRYSKMLVSKTKIGLNPHAFNRLQDLYKWLVNDPEYHRSIKYFENNKDSKLSQNFRIRVLSRLTYFGDGAGKWRYIAIGD